MPLDAYIKFGESTDLGPDGKTYLPLIPGDSDDKEHYWWCELRDCQFKLDASEHSEKGEKGGTDAAKDVPRPELKSITVKKRVDWASASLFTKCCEAANAKGTKIDDTVPDPPGRIKQVTVHICRQSGKKFPFLVIHYEGVVITDFDIDMSGPEPLETITFSAEKFSFEYQQVDRETGEEKGQPRRTGNLNSYTQANAASSQAAAAPPLSVAAAVAAVAAASNGGPSPNGSPATVTSPAGGAGISNFPGLWREEGFGLLPD